MIICNNDHKMCVIKEPYHKTLLFILRSTSIGHFPSPRPLDCRCGDQVRISCGVGPIPEEFDGLIWVDGVWIWVWARFFKNGRFFDMADFFLHFDFIQFFLLFKRCPCGRLNRRKSLGRVGRWYQGIIVGLHVG